MPLPSRSASDRQHVKVDGPGATLYVDLDGVLSDWRIAFLRFVRGPAQVEEQISSGYFQELQRGGAGHWIKVRAGVAAELHDFQVLVDHHAWGTVLFEHQTVSLVLHIQHPDHGMPRQGRPFLWHQPST